MVRTIKVCEQCRMRMYATRMKCGVVNWVKRNTLKCFEHIEERKNEEFVRKECMSETVGPNRRGRPLGRWQDRVKEYMCERGATLLGEP